MPRNKDLKRLVRARMTKTGEAYTAARAQIIKKSQLKKKDSRPPAPGAAAAPAAPSVAHYASIAGMSDDAVEAKTGRTWDRWVRALDQDRAYALSHREMARHIRDKYATPPWWTQMVAVGYERIKGLRGVQQQRDGSFGASKSRTFNVPVTELFAAWSNAATRRRWLAGGQFTVRSATAPKYMRLERRASGAVSVVFTAKGVAKSAVAIEERELPDKAAVERVKQEWAERFDALGEVLAAAHAGTNREVRA